jgi:hypothetical protein
MPLDQAILAEHAYLVSRGVRLVSVIGNGIPDEMESDRSQLGIASIDEPAIPFVIDLENGGTNYGYASHAWAVDLFRWASTRAPDIQAHRIRGLLLGYGRDAIRQFEERSSYRLVASTRRQPVDFLHVSQSGNL